MKIALKIVIFTLLAAVLIVGAVLYVTGQGGESSIEGWIGKQLKEIAGSYLNPTLDFDELDWQYPGTVTVTNLRLTADAPSGVENGRVDILAAKAATIELGKIPKVGEPLVISKIVLEQPQIRAVSATKGHADFVGFTNLLKSDIESTTRKATEGTTTPSGGHLPKLTDVFDIKLIDIRDGLIEYNPRIPGTKPMVLDKIDVRLDVQSNTPGLYELATYINRPDAFDMNVSGKLDINTFVATNLYINVIGALDRGSRGTLPPELSRLLERYQVQGKLNLDVWGELKLLQPLESQLKMTMSLVEARATVDVYQLPIEMLLMEAGYAEKRITMPSLSIDTLSGKVIVNAMLSIERPFDAFAVTTVRNVRLEQLMASKETPTESTLAGSLDAEITANVPLVTLQRHMLSKEQPATGPALPDAWGAGEVNLTEARLVRLPIIGPLVDQIRTVMKLVTTGRTAQPNEKVFVRFGLTGDQIAVQEVRYVGDLAAARGQGFVGLKGALDLVMNAGPLEKMQSLFGQGIGDFMGKFTDALAQYHVTGTVDKPNVQLVVGGNLGKGVSDAVGGAFKGVGGAFRGLGNALTGKNKDKDEKK